MTQNPNGLIGLLIKTHHSAAGLELLLCVPVWKVNHSILKHSYLLSVCLFNYRTVSSMMRVTWTTFIFCFNTLNMRWIWVPLGINTFIFLSRLFFVRAFVKLYLWKVNVRSCVFVGSGATDADSTISNFSLVTLSWWWKRSSNVNSHLINICVFLIILIAVHWILCSYCSIVFLLIKFAASSRCW